MELPSIALKCHNVALTPKETDEVVNAIADLIVDHIKRKRKATAPENRQEGAHEREQSEDIG